MPSRAERLLELLQVLRGRRAPVAASTVAETLGVSLRTLYRDIQSLRAQGADIQGEAGVGYLLRPGFTLPPLMFSPEELDALALGARWVKQNGDADLAKAAERAMVKIAAVAPRDGGEFLDAPSRSCAKSGAKPGTTPWMPKLREAMRAERKVALDYVDAQGAPTQRIVWPVALGFMRDAGSWPPGARRAPRFAISASTASPGWRSRPTAILAAAARCWPNGVRRRGWRLNGGRTRNPGRLPVHRFVRAAKPSRARLEVRSSSTIGRTANWHCIWKVGLNSPGSRGSHSPRAPQRQDVDEQPRSAIAAGKTRGPLQPPDHRLAANDAHGLRRIDRLRRIGAAVNGLAIVTMTEHLGDRFRRDFDRDGPAAALDCHHRATFRRRPRNAVTPKHPAADSTPARV